MCEHKNAMIYFKTVSRQVKIVNGKAVMPRAVKTDDMCVSHCYCTDCEQTIEWYRPYTKYKK